MRVFVISLLAIVVIALSASYLLSVSQTPAYQAFSAPQTVRLTQEDAGHNLVGTW